MIRNQRLLQNVDDIIVLGINSMTVLIDDGNGQHRNVAIVHQQAKKRCVDASRLSGKIPFEKRLAAFAYPNAAIALSLHRATIDTRKPERVHTILLTEFHEATAA